MGHEKGCLAVKAMLDMAALVDSPFYGGGIMIRELIIGVSVAVIAVGAHAARAEAAAPLDSCSWKVCVSGDFCGALGWELCHASLPAGCIAAEGYCSEDWYPPCGGPGYVQCEAIQQT